MADWVTISALATASATYGSVRSANRAARVAEQSLRGCDLPGDLGQKRR
jgi:hypothetical protein